jgi:hypothetical protein
MSGNQGARDVPTTFWDVSKRPKRPSVARIEVVVPTQKVRWSQGPFAWRITRCQMRAAAVVPLITLRTLVRGVLCQGTSHATTAVALIAVVVACQSVSTPAKPIPRSQGILILTASDHLQRLSSTTGKFEWDVALGGETQSDFTAHLMAMTGDRTQVAVLVRGPVSQVVIVDATTGRELARHTLPAGLLYRGLYVGPISGHIYVFANRELGPDRGPTQGPLSDAVVTVLAADLSLMSTRTVRSSSGFDWFVYQGATDASESHLLISYHGPDTTGVDLIAINGNRVVNPCNKPGEGCIRSHGGFVSTSDHLYLATGSSPVIEVDPTGTTVREIETGISNEHIMELAIDSTQSQMFIAGSCKYSSGLFAIDLGSLRVRTLAKQFSNVCGERVFIPSASSVIVVDPDISIVDAATGRVEVRLQANGTAVDGIVAAA